MKKNLLLLAVITFISNMMWCQTILFNYDKAGNRILRDIPVSVLLKSDSSTSTIDIEHENIERIKTLSVKPNPTTGNFNVLISNYNDTTTYEIFLYDLGGDIIYKNYQVESNTSIDISSEKSGIYYLSLIVNDERFMQKLIKY